MKEGLNGEWIDEGLTPDQEQQISKLITKHPDVQMLLQRLMDLEGETMWLREQLEYTQTELEKMSKFKRPAQVQAALGGPLLCSPVTVLANTMDGVRRYIEATANEGMAARRLPSGEIVVDLEHPELKDFLPANMPPALVHRTIKQTRGHTTRVSASDRAFMGWDESRRTRYAFVFLPGT